MTGAGAIRTGGAVRAFGPLRAAGPPADIVDIWCVRVDAPEFPHAALAATLDVEEREHAARLRARGRAWAAAHGARRAILASYLDVRASALQFITGASGKPRLVNVPGLEFSFAHTDGMALVAVACDREVGVDVERENARTNIDLVAREFLPLREAAALQATPLYRRRAAFFHAWVQHEARLKLHGHGLTADFSEQVRAAYASAVVRTLTLPPGFAGAVAAANRDWAVRYRDFQPACQPTDPLQQGAAPIRT